ncbi:MAG: hypothetical protein L3J33_03330 [Rhodobacteraceae bacterium]|nr:hypothetical protein [Paracoccaceae bacterium]
MNKSGPARLQFCRDIAICITCGIHCNVDPAHTRFPDALFGKYDSGIALKPNDAFTLPLCRDCHETQHGGGERQFWTDRGFQAGSITEGPIAAGLILTGFYNLGFLDQAKTWTQERAKLARAYQQRNI